MKNKFLFICIIISIIFTACSNKKDMGINTEGTNIDDNLDKATDGDASSSDASDEYVQAEALQNNGEATSGDAMVEGNDEEGDSNAQLAKDELVLNQKFDNVHKLVSEKADDYYLQGTVLVGVGDEVVYAESFGMASEWENKENKNTTRYGIASLTKSFTAAAIMKLYEEGKLDLKDNISKYFPDYSYGNQITILELLQMRSGIVDYLNDMGSYMTVSDSKAIYDSFVEKGDFKGLDEYPWTREDMLKNCYNNELIFTPDERYSYSNTNYYLLGCIVEQVSGITYEEYIENNIFKPANMTSSNFSAMKNDAVGYMLDEGFVSSNYETLFSAGGIRSNAFDMFSWLRNLSKGNILSKDTYELMIDTSELEEKNRKKYEEEQAKLKEELGEAYEEPKVDPDYVPTYYCCGLMVTGSKVWHQGYIDGFSNYMSIDMDTDVTIILLTNTSEKRCTYDITGLWNEINDATNSALGISAH